MTITASGTTGSVTLTTSADYFVSGHVGTDLLIGETRCRVTGFTSATHGLQVTGNQLVTHF